MNADANQAKSIFLEAVEKHATEEWIALLDQACAGQPELRQRVEALLEAHREVGTRAHQAAADDPAIPPLDCAEQPGTIIGPYKLLQQIGEGGFGIVFMAERSEPVRQIVALKIIKPGMDSRQVIARFEAERQALAMMDHPNIAKVFDAGSTTRRASVLACSEGESKPNTSEDACATETGRPFFVMELVKGVPITKYCDDNQLTLKERLELFIPVCQAVMHAHQKGIIHRDLKPPNVLVARYDDKPVPKVIDFGVAKATGQKLTERTLFTQFGQLVGTLEYMSPEQATLNALDIDTRSDIYSLGVLLYELLAGSTPFEKKRLKETAFDEVLRIIREEEPPKPSKRLSDSKETLANIAPQRKTEPVKLTKLVRGDLDWIVMKALEKDRNRRYDTAESLTADVERYLAYEPVMARAPTAMYRLRKFVRRHLGALLVSAAAAVALIGLLASIGWAIYDRQSREAEAALKQHARDTELLAKLKTLLAASNLLIDDRHRSLARQTLAEAKKLLAADREALSQVVGELENLTAGDPETANVYNELARLLVMHSDSKLQNPGQAVTLAKKAVAMGPNVGGFWNTLGVAQYRACNWQGTIDACIRAMQLKQDHDRWNMFFTAMASWKLGYKDAARQWYERGCHWMETHTFDESYGNGLRFRNEAARLLRLPEPGPNLVEQGWAFAWSRQWKKALNCYEKAGVSVPGNGAGGYELACLFLLVGDEAGYRRTCAELLDTGASQPKGNAVFIARACALAPQTERDRLRAEEISSAQMVGKQSDSILVVRASEAYRSGRYEEALEDLHDLVNNSEVDAKIMAWHWVALTYHAMHNGAEAKKWLETAKRWQDNYSGFMAEGRAMATVHRHTWLESHILLREMKAAIRSGVVGEGTEKRN